MLCEFSQHHVCIALAGAGSKRMQQLSYYELKNGLAPDTLRDIIQNEKLHPAVIKRVVLSSALKEIVLVPANHFTEESARRFYTTTYGNTADALFFDDLTEQHVVLVHAVPQAVMGILKSSYGTETKHFYSCQLMSDNGSDDADLIAVHFTGKEIYVVVKKEEQLKLVQTYFYTTPLDVVYYLLSVCWQYDLSQSGTTLILSGLVSEDSAMYKELHQYFSTLHFWKPAPKATLQNDYAPHFFSSLYNLARCVL